MRERRAPQQQRSEASPDGLNSALRRMDLASSHLLGWYESADSTDRRVLQARAEAYSAACSLLKDLPIAAQSYGRFLRLTVGEESVATHQLSQNDRKRLERQPGPILEPGQTFILLSVTNGLSEGQDAPNVYLGNLDGAVEVADIARILATGGKLDLAETGQYRPKFSAEDLVALYLGLGEGIKRTDCPLPEHVAGFYINHHSGDLDSAIKDVLHGLNYELGCLPFPGDEDVLPILEVALALQADQTAVQQS